MTGSQHRTGLRKASFQGVDLRQNHSVLMRNAAEGGDADLGMMEVHCQWNRHRWIWDMRGNRARGSCGLSVGEEEAEGARCDSTLFAGTTSL